MHFTGLSSVFNPTEHGLFFQHLKNQILQVFFMSVKYTNFTGFAFKARVLLLIFVAEATVFSTKKERFRVNIYILILFGKNIKILLKFNFIFPIYYGIL